VRVSSVIVDVTEVVITRSLDAAISGVMQALPHRAARRIS
jgi:hypothetical protein